MKDYSETIFNLVEYEVWCNLQVLDFFCGLSDEECRRDFGFGLRTPHRTISHIADVMRGWSGCVGPRIEESTWPPYDETETLQEIRHRMAATGASWLAAAKDSHAHGVLAEERRLNQLFHLGNYSAGMADVRQGGTIGLPAKTLVNASMTLPPFLRMVEM